MSAVATKQLISHLEYVSVQVKDQEAARLFYIDALGFEVDEDKSYPDGQRWLTVRAPGAQTKLVLFADPQAQRQRRPAACWPAVRTGMGIWPIRKPFCAR